MIITLTWSQSKSTKTMLKRCESSWERTTFALEVRLDELREQPWCSSHTQSNPLQSYSFFLLSSTGPNGYPIPGCYPTLFPILGSVLKIIGYHIPKCLTELQKRADRADQSVLFFLASANFWEKHAKNRRKRAKTDENTRKQAFFWC